MRTLREIAQDVRKDWKNVNYAAEPYLQAMSEMVSVDDMYYNDSAYHVIMYFLGNAQTWRGEKARKIKNELKAML